MPTHEAVPSQDTVAPDTKPHRDRAVDVARLSALLVVMFGHCALLLATIDSGGVRVGNILGALPALAPITWVLQVMPLFFLAGGAAGAYSLHPADARSDVRSARPWGAWLLTRAQRLCRPVFWYLAVWAVVLLVVHATMGAESAAALGRECVALLWFLGVYLVALAFVPGLMRVHTGRALALVVVGLIAASGVVDSIRFAVGTPEAGTANLIIVWLIPVVIGVAYARHLICARRALGIAVVAFTAQVILALTGIYDVSLVVTGTERVSNVSPPTLLLALQCTWMPCLFIAAADPIRRWAARPRVWYVVAMGNGGAMTLYLWHIPVIAIAAFSLHAVGLDAFDPHVPGFWAHLALRAVVFAVLMAVAFRLLSPLEHRPLPWWDSPVQIRGARSVLTGALLCVAGAALTLLAKNGLDGVLGWAALGGFVIAAVAARASAGRVTGARA
ncbi:MULTISPECIES: acyltransferase [unclassified Mycolicibacterium]|uniref:acyltransferase family protein n=1 Tax=unclassified Mycolicibacterium TaxID=2636767 RepID=UPI0012DD0097|nr:MULTISPECIES: acyltransferase [unclassified Mycolicibacterium]MUL85392.1 acyltransferase [Mycolicibacterium sp. CBMA 329]MUL88844.1 acyltransferase [Mycolicibacterium sp. CBMA 331]MUM01882.1 acyltransferase [Mycolicibacterium sp. CBMA 334]MUM27609.1 acyltransferase [Mycolicibacterium sp. CBMA 295]MUM40491.1 acyltransferase [Mycolicibacterium sp. CBMA 247]